MPEDFYQRLSGKQLEAAMNANSEIEDLKRQLELQLAVMKDIKQQNVRMAVQLIASREREATLIEMATDYRHTLRRIEKMSKSYESGIAGSPYGILDSIGHAVRVILRDKGDESEVGDATD